jgi:hypothetical protein
MKQEEVGPWLGALLSLLLAIALIAGFVWLAKDVPDCDILEQMGRATDYNCG